MIVEYAMHWGPPDGAMKWPLLQLMLAKRSRIEAREVLAVVQGTRLAIAEAFGSDGSNQATSTINRIESIAHPGQQRTADEVFQKSTPEPVNG